MNEDIKKQTAGGFLWRLLQNISAQVISFVIQIVLARILLPEDYSIVSIISVFMLLVNVFINTGFSSALVQKQDIRKIDLSSAFYAGIAVSLVLYGVLFVSAPAVAAYYEMPLIQPMLRVQGLSVIIAASYSVHQALITKQMAFQKSMLAAVISGVVQGAVGITMALNGFGTWSLITANVVHSLVLGIVLWCAMPWRPGWEFSFGSVRRLLSLSIKVLAINLINTLYNNIVSLVIGKVYDPTALAYYNRGYQFPTLVMVGVDGALTTVLFSALSRVQDDEKTFMELLRRSMRTSLFVCSALMLGMLAVAEPMIEVLLTDKWLGAVPYVRICCLLCLTWPLSALSQAIIAKGKGGVALAKNLAAKATGLVCLAVAVRYDVYTFVFSSLIASLISHVVAMVVYRHVIGYGYGQQLRDMLTPMWYAGVMLAVIYPLNRLPVAPIWKLVIMVPAGVAVFVGLAWVTKSPELRYLWGFAKGKLKKGGA